MVAPSRVIISAALCCTKKLQKICALEKKQAAKKLIISSCTPTTSALLLYHYYTTAVWPVRTVSNAAIRAYTLLLYHDCCMYVRTAVNASYPQNSRRHGFTYCQYYNNGDGLLNMGRQQRVPRQRRSPSLETPGRPGCGVASCTSYTRVALQTHGASYSWTWPHDERRKHPRVV